MVAAMDAMVDTARGPSLRSLGYVDVGLDDAYQVVGGGVDGSFHRWDAAGELLRNVIDEATFPDMRAMNEHASKLGLRTGFYNNNCIGKEKNFTGAVDIDAHYRGDVADIEELGFSGTKLDGCGQFRDLERWQALLNETESARRGKFFLIENCHWGQTVPTLDWCPFSFFRTSGDIHPNWARMFENLQSVVPFTGEEPLSRPGCWAYADMLEVGMMPSPAEDRSHFGAWVITSNPLILGFDLRDAGVLDRVWGIIANDELIAINQAWAGHPGRLVHSAPLSVRGVERQALQRLRHRQQQEPRPQAHAGATDAPAFSEDVKIQVWAKPLPRGAVAVYVVSNADPGVAQEVHIDFKVIGLAASAASVRCAYGHRDLGTVDAENGFLTDAIEGHDSRMYVFHPAATVAQPRGGTWEALPRV